MRRPILQRAASRAGFTLLEMLVAVVVLVMILAMLVLAFDQGQRNWVLGGNRVESFQVARQVLDQMSMELAQAVASSNLAFRGAADRVDFIAPLASETNELADLCEVTYRHDSTVGRWAIVRELTPPTTATIGSTWNIYDPAWWNPPAATATLLASNSVLRLEFRYYSGGSESTTWSATDRLPQAIRITVEAMDPRTAARLQKVASVGAVYQQVTNETVRGFSALVRLFNARP
jgi:prepilin-type N-terminal cleavage/methylation domain-containing protein